MPQCWKGAFGSLLVIAVGLLILALQLWLLDDEEEPYNEYRLIRYGRTSTARVVKTWNEVEEWNDGHRAGWVPYCVYRFSVPNGGVFNHRLRGEDVRVGESLTIEYLPSNPDVSRVKGSGSSTIKKWLLRLPFSVLYIALFAAAGGSMIWHGLKELAKDIRSKAGT